MAKVEITPSRGRVSYYEVVFEGRPKIVRSFLAGLSLGFVREEKGALLLGPTLTLQEVADEPLLGAPGLDVLRQAARRIYDCCSE